MSRTSQDPGALSPVKQALLAVKDLRAQLDTVERARKEPIAIIGLGCRFPGATGPEAYWRLLHEGLDAISEVPADRWDVDAFYDPDVAAPGKMNTRWGGFIPNVDQFDAGYFGISPREALWMDPQQRILLEVASEALEHAGQAPAHLSGTLGGVFIGISSSDYVWHQLGSAGDLDAYASTGTAYSIVANRLSYMLDLKGPSLAVDTACSSSLVALHLACQSLRNQECHIALAGGVNLVLSPIGTISLSKFGMMAPDGRCKPFDSRADGFVRGEGCGVVVLKRLSDAVAAGDPILALIRGSAVNQDGRSNGLTAPNMQAQQTVVERALALAGIAPDQLQYIEAHGTGTALGDPIEVEALAAVFGPYRENARQCALASVKSNIGHLEAAAGVAGLIKIVLALQHEAIPAHLHFRDLNPHISLAQTPFFIPTEEQPWPRGECPRYAGQSGFGFGGTNVHVVLEEAPQQTVGRTPWAEADPPVGFGGTTSRTQGSAVLLPLSARSPQALEAMKHAYADYLDGDPPIHDVCYTASVRRAHHPHRLAVVGTTAGELAERLREHESAASVGRGAPVFVFSGQGGHWAGMGRELLGGEPVFRGVVEECDALLRHYVRCSLVDELRSEEPRSQQEEIAQPALFALQVGLATLWRSWGIEPAAVVGQSLGEIAAAHVAGILSLPDAIRIVAHRGRLMQGVRGLGAMLAVELGREDVARFTNGSVWLAASNSPSASVLSGEAPALKAVAASLLERGVHHRDLGLPYASHCPQMAPVQRGLEEALRGLQPRAATLPILSTLTGRLAEGRDFDAAYWGRQLREPVRFVETIDTAIDRGHELFLEISPHSLLGRPVMECLQQRGKTGAVLPSLRKDCSAREVMMESLGRLYTMGQTVSWARLYPEKGVCVPLPAYPWQHERFWPEKRPGQAGRLGSFGNTSGAEHPLLGPGLQPAGNPGLQCWQTDIGLDVLPYLGDHRLQGSVLLPAAAYVEAALAAGGGALEQIAFKAPLFLTEGKGQTIQTVVSGEDFQFFSRQSGAWLAHSRAKIRPAGDPAPHDSIDEIRRRCQQVTDGPDFYKKLYQGGLEYGPLFQGVQQVWRRDGEALARLKAPAGGGSYRVHPALLDAAFQTLMAALSEQELSGAEGQVFLPVGIDRLQLYKRPGSDLWAHAVNNDVFLLDDSGEVVLEARGFRAQLLAGDRWLYEVKWLPKERAETGAATGSWLVHGRAQGSEPFVELLRTRKETICSGLADSPDRVICFGDCEAALGVLKQMRTGRLWLAIQSGDLKQAPVAGLARVIALEHPELWGGLVELDTSEAWVSLFEEIRHTDGEDQIAFRDGHRYIARLARHRHAGPAKDRLRLPEDATYWITGGLGGLGLQVARWMVERGARHLVLSSRRPAAGPALEAIAALEQRGARIVVRQADVASQEQVAQLAAEIRSSGHPLRGVVHAAGVLDDGPLRDLGWDRFVKVLGPKVDGAWNLHSLTLDQPLDFFVMFSSMASMVGSPGQGNYAAANAYLDALASYRQAQGLPALSINWGPWSEVGLAAGLKREGIGSITPRAGVQILERLIQQPASQVGVIDIDWRIFQMSSSAPRLLADLIEEQAQPAASSQFKDELRAAQPGERPRMIEDYLCRQLARVLKSSASRIDPASSLTSLGIDSLMAVELRSRVQADLGVLIPLAEIFTCPTIRALAEYLVQASEGVVPTARNIAVMDMSGEAVLDPEITLRTPAEPVTRPAAIFLTGATGFLGGYLLLELLKRTDADIYCLVRAKDAQEGHARLATKVKSAGPGSAARIKPVVGDLRERLFGLAPDEYDALSSCVDTIYHSGADVNFVRNYESLKPSTVIGTTEVLRFAVHNRTKPLHHVSSIAVYGSPAYLGKVRIYEDDSLAATGLAIGYFQTKWVAEQLVTIAKGRGIPASIYRPAQIAGHSQTGDCKLNDLLPMLIRGFIQLGLAPSLDSLLLDFTPVDEVCRMIVRLAGRPELLGKAFNLVARRQLTMDQILDVLSSAGYRIRRVPYPEWRQALRDAPSDNPLGQMLPFFEKLDESLLKSIPLDAENTRRGLEGSDASLAAPDELLRIYLDYFVRIGFIPAPPVHPDVSISRPEVAV